MTCTWEDVSLKKTSIAEAFIFDGVEPGSSQAKPTNSDIFPGAMNSGWEDYYQWASKDFGAWQGAFQKAECERLKESKRWLAYYDQVYNDDMAFWKKVTMYALNGIQLWALWKQFRQQKEIAKRTYDIANRIQTVGEEMYNFYEKTYQPQEEALNNQINGHFDGSCIDYSIADRFGANVARAFGQVKAGLFRCNSSHCQAPTASMMKQFEIEKAQSIGNARTGAYRWAEMVKEHKDMFYLEMRMKFIQVGRGISVDGQNGIMKAFGTFSNFGADPGAALSKLLDTFSNTLGMVLNDKVAPTGKVPNFQSQTFEPFMTRVKQSGDVQQGKVEVPLGKATTRSY